MTSTTYAGWTLTREHGHVTLTDDRTHTTVMLPDADAAAFAARLAVTVD